MALNWQQEVALWSAGDFTADGLVNVDDLNLLALNWQQSIPDAGINAIVPEPSTIALALSWILFVVARRRAVEMKTWRAS